MGRCAGTQSNDARVRMNVICVWNSLSSLLYSVCCKASHVTLLSQWHACGVQLPIIVRSCSSHKACMEISAQSPYSSARQ